MGNKSELGTSMASMGLFTVLLDHPIIFHNVFGQQETKKNLPVANPMHVCSHNAHCF